MSVATARAPFLVLDSFSSEVESEAPAQSAGYGLADGAPYRSPFVSVYEAGDDEAAYDDPMREVYAELLSELHDEEFDEALFELESQARGMHQQQLARGVPRYEADQSVMQHFAPLVRECELMFEAMAREFGPRERAGLAQAEIETFVDRYTPDAQFEPQLEQLFGKLGKVLKSAAGKALQGIKKIGLGPILSRIKALIKPLLQRVLQKAIGHLPAPLRPAAQQLARKLGFAADNEMADAAVQWADPGAQASGVQEVAGSDAPSLQQEFDQQVANAMLAQDETQLDMEVAQSAVVASAPGAPVFAELDDARERFIQELNELRPGESAQPQIQNFLPAVLPALKLGIRLVGRPRVINFLSPLLSKLIASLIGPQQAPVLSRAIVDAGLKLLSLEMSEDEVAGLGASAVAATVEEAIGRIAALPDHVLDQQELLEGYALEAFEQAAAANLPAVLSQGTYRQRPELLEAGVNAGWVMLPLRGRKRYKRCTRTFDVRITPHIAAEVLSFEGAPLADHLHDQLGLVEGEDIDAQLHLFEALPGTDLADIARNESEAGGGTDPLGIQSLHPLTPQAAAALMGAPGMGRSFATASPQLAAGQRVYRLAIAGRRTTPHGSVGQRRRLMHVNLHFDCVHDQIRACVFLSEVKAQKLAVRLRQATNAGLLISAFARSLHARLHHIFFGDGRRRLHVVSASVPPQGSVAGAAAGMKNLPQGQAQRYAAALQNWLVQGFAQFIQAQSAQLIAAAEAPDDGVTLRFVIEKPPALKAVCEAMSGQGAAPALAQSLQQSPVVHVTATAGHRCG